jgi:hypothetical protein
MGKTLPYENTGERVATSSKMIGVNQQPPMQQFKMTLLKPFLG